MKKKQKKTKDNNLSISNNLLKEYDRYGAKKADFDLALIMAFSIENSKDRLPTLFLMGFALGTEIQKIKQIKSNA